MISVQFKTLEPVSKVQCRATTGMSRDQVDISTYQMAYYESPDIRLENIAVADTGTALLFMKGLCIMVKDGLLKDGRYVWFGDQVYQAVMDRSNYRKQNQYGVLLMVRTPSEGGNT